MAPKLTLKDLYGERGAARFTKQRNPANVRVQREYPNGRTSPANIADKAPPAVQQFRRVPGQPIPGGYGSHYGDEPSSAFAPTTAVAKVLAAYAAGAVVIGLPQPNMLIGVAAANIDWVMEADRLQGTVRKAYFMLGQSVYRWSTTLQRWAAAGRRDDGTSYSWGQWYDQGKTLLDGIIYQAGIYVDPTIATAFVEAIQATGTQILSPTKWPWYMQAAAVAGALFLAGKFIGEAKNVASVARFPKVLGYHPRRKKK